MREHMGLYTPVVRVSDICLSKFSVTKGFLASFLLTKLLLPQASNFIKKETLAQVFSCKCWEISKNTFFYRTPPVAASESWFENMWVNRQNTVFHEL